MVANIFPADSPPAYHLDPGGGVKGENSFQNMVMLHIKLKGITNADG